MGESRAFFCGGGRGHAADPGRCRPPQAGRSPWRATPAYRPCGLGPGFAASPERLLALDEALVSLAKQDAAAAELVKLRLFAGLSIEEAAAAMGLSRASAYRHWTYARAWLRAELADG